MGRTEPEVSDAAVEDATGRDWESWLSLLDEAGATEKHHKAIVSLVAEAGVENGWWQQTVAVGYERLRGLREVGETADAGFQVGVQRTLPVAQKRLWSILFAPEWRTAWLGETEGFETESGTHYETTEGTTGEVRTVDPPNRIRLTWQPADRDSVTTLQLTLACPQNEESKTTLRFHHEGLSNGAEREEMREHWREALDRIEGLVEDEVP